MPGHIRHRYAWEQLDDAALLKVRFRDLKLDIARSPVSADLERLGLDLARRGIRFAPHYWFSTEWFSPDGIPGIAVPFYLAHPRLTRLEKRMMGEAEGSNRSWRRRLLRHELGHAVDTAFALRRRRDWRDVFGPASARYASDYAVRPLSRDHVLHLEHWYAQSHPTEDFAETFAVWLGPKARWRAEYAGWPALEKLEFVDALMSDLAGHAPKTRDRSRIAPLAENGRTLGEHYRRRGALGGEHAGRYDAWLLRVFARRTTATQRSAERLLLDLKPELTTALLRRSGVHPYTVFQLLRAVRRRARFLDLVIPAGKRDARHATERLHERVLANFLRRNAETYFL